MKDILMIVLAITVPSLLGAGVLYYANRYSGMIKKILMIIIGAVLPHVFAFSVLDLIMGRFDLSIASIRFKLLYMLLAMIPSIIIFLYTRFRDKLSALIKDYSLIAYLGVSFFLVFTYFIYIPTVTVILNIDEFMIKLVDAFIVFALEAVIAVILLVLAGIVLKDHKRRDILMMIVFYVAFAMYIQYNFLNKNLPSMTGEFINWDSFSSDTIIGLIVWGIILFAVVIAFLVVDRLMLRKILAFLSAALTVMQLVSLLFSFRAYFTALNSNESSMYSVDGEFEVGNESNVLIFLVDSLDADLADSYVTSGYYGGELKDFDYFDNIIAGGSPTTLGCPAFLTGIEYDPEFDFAQYSRSVTDYSVLDSYYENGYDVRLYTSENIGQYHTENIHDADANTISNKSAFAKSTNRMVNYMVLPFGVKKFFYSGTESIVESVFGDSGRYNDMNYKFYEDLIRESGLTSDTSKALRIIHLWGVHSPYYNDEDCRKIEPTDAPEQLDRTFGGVLMAIDKYMDYLKDEGLYENSTIIIMGDHGSSLYKLNKSRPAVFIKLSKEYDHLSADCTEKSDSDQFRSRIDAPYSFWNLTNLLREISGDKKKGLALYEPTGGLDAVRLHTDRIGDGTGDDASGYARNGYLRSEVNARIPADFSKGTEEVLTPYDSGNVNRIKCRMGDKIDLTDRNEGYVTVSEGKLYAGYELTLNLDIEDYKDGNIVYSADYNGIIGDYQRIILFAGRDHVTDIEILNNGEGSYSVIIPGSCVEDGVLHIRQVYPYAGVTELDRKIEASVIYEDMRLSYTD